MAHAHLQHVPSKWNCRSLQPMCKQWINYQINFMQTITFTRDSVKANCYDSDNDGDDNGERRSYVQPVHLLLLLGMNNVIWKEGWITAVGGRSGWMKCRWKRATQITIQNDVINVCVMNSIEFNANERENCVRCKVLIAFGWMECQSWFSLLPPLPFSLSSFNCCCVLIGALQSKGVSRSAIAPPPNSIF